MHLSVSQLERSQRLCSEKPRPLPFPGKDKSDLWQWTLLTWSDLQRSTQVLSGQTAAWISQVEPPSALSMTSKAPSSLPPVAPQSFPSVANVLASRWLSFTLWQLLFLTGLKQFKDIQCSFQYSAVFWGVFLFCFFFWYGAAFISMLTALWQSATMTPVLGFILLFQW